MIKSLGLGVKIRGDSYSHSDLARKIHEFRGTKGPAMVQNRCLCGFETKREAFA